METLDKPSLAGTEDSMDDDIMLTRGPLFFNRETGSEFGAGDVKATSMFQGEAHSG